MRRRAFCWRCDTPEALVLLNQLWEAVNDRMSYFAPTKKPVGFGTDKAGRRKRLYDKPRTPFDRLLDAAVLSPAQHGELEAYLDALNPPSCPPHPNRPEPPHRPRPRRPP